MGEQPYRQVDRVDDVCEDYDVLIGPDGFQCFLGEPEDRCWRRDGKAVVDELNRLHAEIARLKGELDAWKARFRAIVDSDSPDAAGNAVLTLKADAAKDAEMVEHLKAAGAAMRKSLVCFNIRRHPRTSISRDESERVVNEWDDAVNGTRERVK